MTLVGNRYGRSDRFEWPRNWRVLWVWQIHWYTNWLSVDIETTQLYQLDKCQSCRLVLFQEDRPSPLTT